MASLFRPPRQTREGRDCPGIRHPSAAGDQNQYDPVACEAHGGSRLVLLTVIAFVLPLVVIVVVVQFLEHHVGAAGAAITGLAAAGLMIAMSAGMVKRFACWPAATGADR
jgi:hypothetical protein